METIAPESDGLSSSRLQRIDRAMQGYIDREQLTGLITVLLHSGEVSHAIKDSTCHRMYSKRSIPLPSSDFMGQLPRP